MSSGWDLVLIGVALIAYAAFSRRLSGTMVTSAMLFVAAGILAGGEVFDLFETQLGSDDLRLLAEVTLALVLFSDASALDARRLRRESKIPVRLLGVGLPLSIVLGTVVAIPLFSQLGVYEALILAVMLAPTDAALGQTVVADRRVPGTLRQGLSVESGLNDGVCVPILVTAVALAEIDQRPSFEGEVLVDLFKEVSIALVVGAAIAVAVAAVMRLSERRGWLSEEWAKIVPLATAAMVYAGAAELGGSGFIAAFVAGLVYGQLLGPLARRTVTLDEELGQLLSAVTFLLFGAAMVGPAVTRLDVETVVYAVLSLTVVRMVPVAISFLGTGAGAPTMAFAGWFGPRGLATVVFALTIVEESRLPGTRTITDVATITVLLSVFAHGLSAPWLTTRYSRLLTRHPDRLSGDAAAAVTPT